jgi:hypothetical protein
LGVGIALSANVKKATKKRGNDAFKSVIGEEDVSGFLRLFEGDI